VMWVMGRTTGFSTVDLSAVDDGTAAGGVGLMLIGGVAGSTAGGVKVGTAMVLAVAVWSGLRGRGQAEAFGREIPQATVVRAMTIVLVFVGAIALGTWLLALTDDAPFLSTLFTAASALGTVGWSRGVEPGLDTAGALIVTGLMFFGRLAPLVLATAVSHGGPARFRYPPASIRVG
jgi:trk system potassium uptake protein TrkH